MISAWRELFNDVSAMVAEGKADIGFMIGTGIPEMAVKYKLLYNVPFQAVVACDHPLAGKGEVTLSDLEDEPQLVITSRGEERGTEVTAFSRRVWILESYTAALSMIEKGVGWAFLPEPMLGEAINKRNMVHLCLELEGRVHTSPLYLIWNSDTALGKPGQWLFNHFRQPIKHF